MVKAIEYLIKTIWLKLMGYTGPYIFSKKSDFSKYDEACIDLEESWKYHCLSNLYYRKKSSPLYRFTHNNLPFNFCDSNKQVFNPLAVAHHLLCTYNKMIIENEQHLPLEYMSNLEFLISKADINQRGIFWYYYDESSNAKRTGKYISGITQGMILSVLLRAHIYNPDPKLKEYILLCYKSLFIPVNQNGVLRFMREGPPWIDEYPLTGPHYVLNGFLFSIIALLEFEKLFPNEKQILSSGQLVNTFIKTYPRFRVGGYLKYSLKNRQLSNIKYEGLHAWQLYHLAKLTNNKTILAYLNEWTEMMNWGYYTRHMKLIKVVKPEINVIESHLISFVQ